MFATVELGYDILNYECCRSNSLSAKYQSFTPLVGIRKSEFVAKTKLF